MFTISEKSQMWIIPIRHHSNLFVSNLSGVRANVLSCWWQRDVSRESALMYKDNSRYQYSRTYIIIRFSLSENTSITMNGVSRWDILGLLLLVVSFQDLPSPRLREATSGDEVLPQSPGRVLRAAHTQYAFADTLSRNTKLQYLSSR